MGEIVITVAGTPAPQGSKRHLGNGVMTESSKAVRPWREAVKAAALATGSSMLRCPVEVGMDFYFKRPRSHYGTGRNALTVKRSAPWRPKGKPDLDKLARAAMDALTDAGIWDDDAQVVTAVLTKNYALSGQAPGAIIRVREVTPL